MINTISSEQQGNTSFDPPQNTQQKSYAGCWITFAIALAIILLVFLVIAIIVLVSSAQSYNSNNPRFQPASITYSVLNRLTFHSRLSGNTSYILQITTTPTDTSSPTITEPPSNTPVVSPTFASTPSPISTINPTATTPPYEVEADNFSLLNIGGVSMIGLICLLQFFTLIVILKLSKSVNSLHRDTAQERVELPNPISSTPLPATKMDSTPAPSISKLRQDTMLIKPIKAGFIKYVTRSKTRTESNNQDSGLCGEISHARYIAVADGVGSARNSKIASLKLVNLFETAIKSLSNTQQAHLLNEPQTIKKFYERSAIEIGETLIQNKLPQNSAATTFIGIIETENRYLVTYLADGSVYRIMQSSDGEKLIAHSLLRTVNSVTSPDTPGQISAKGRSEEPQIITYTQNSRGDMWVIATDGINDFNPDGDKNIQTEKIVQKLADEIWQAFKKNPNEFENTLGMILERWLKRCQTTDDATLAILISGNMREHWQKLVGQ